MCCAIATIIGMGLSVQSWEQRQTKRQSKSCEIESAIAFGLTFGGERREKMEGEGHFEKIETQCHVEIYAEALLFVCIVQGLYWISFWGLILCIIFSWN